MSRYIFAVGSSGEKRLEATSKDASSVYALFMAKSVGDCHQGSPPPLECESIDAFSPALNNLIRKWDPEDQLVFYFSGHGEQRGNKYCLVLGPDNVDLFPFDELLGRLEINNVKKAILILDACAAGQATKKSGGNDATIEVPSLHPNINESELPAGMAILASSGPAQFSWENENGDASRFTEALVQVLRHGIDDGDEYLWVDQVIERVSELLQNAQEHSEKPQDPVFSVQGRTRLWLAKNIVHRKGASEPDLLTNDVFSHVDLELLAAEKLSEEHPSKLGSLEDINWDLVNDYRSQDNKGRETELTATGIPEKDLENLNLLSPVPVQKRRVPHYSAALCFCNLPDQFHPESLTIYVEIAESREDDAVRLEVRGPLVQQLREVTEIVKSRIGPPHFYVDDKGDRQERPEFDLEVFREVLANAMVHRDFRVNGNVEVRLTQTHVEVSNPGSLLRGREFQEVLDSTFRSVPRNPLLLLFMNRLRRTEQIGRGFRFIREYRSEQGKDAVECVESDGPVTVFRLRRFRQSGKRVAEFSHAAQPDASITSPKARQEIQDAIGKSSPPASELAVYFPSATELNVSFDGIDSGKHAFVNPLTERDRSDIRWYVGVYGAASLADPDDQEAKRIETRLSEIGKSLFEAVFGMAASSRVFRHCADASSERHVLTLKSDEASVHALPWELLSDPDDTFLFRGRPRFNIRRQISGATAGRKPFAVKPKDQLHLLFVISRPTDAGFIDPRADSQAILDALDEHAPGRVTYELLQPATLDALANRLEDRGRPEVDILHFDGHGVFAYVSEEDAEKHPELYGKSILSEIMRAEHSFGVPESVDPAAARTSEYRGTGLGFLVFESKDGTRHLISASDLGDNLFRSRVRLVVLSACQTATLDSEGDPMASIAGRLVSTGIPAVLAMPHPVLVATTKMLFGRFYECLARGQGVASALDDARIYIANNPERYEVSRGDKRRMLELQDWFVPTLFHIGADSPLLSQVADSPASVPKTMHNLRPRHEAGFFGRRRELWDIERWFATMETKRVSIVGFGGQGKTELALEAGRWMLRTGMFQQAVFIDYSGVQSHDALAAAISTISAVLEESLASADKVTERLRRTATLLILDGLEVVEPEALQELLTAAAVWSRAGESRLLLTSRIPDFDHPDYAIAGSLKHRRIVLEGLGSAHPDDALEWFRQLNLLPSAEPSTVPPPRRDELISLFDRVRFHPLSIRVLVQQLKTRTAEQLEERLEQLLRADAVSPAADMGTPDSLIASLELSLERLSEEERHAARRLGVFQGGALESELLAITGLGTDDQQREQLQALLSALEGGDPRVLLRTMGMDIPDDAQIPPELLAQLTDNPELQQHVEQLRGQLAALPETASESAAENLWSALRRSLEAAALIESETVPGVGPPFLRFHPTLAPMLWAALEADERDALTLAHRQRYFALAGYLYSEDAKNPHQARAIARRELPNLLHAVHGALDAGDADAVDFADSVNRFLNNFGMTREAARLTRRAEQAGGHRGSHAWYLAQSNRGEQLLASGRVAEAAAIFADILETLDDQYSYNRALTLSRLGRCYAAGGRPDMAEQAYRQGIAVTEQLEASNQVKGHRGALHTDLADVVMYQGRFAEAREHYERGLEIVRELNDVRAQGVSLGQLGTLALQEGDLAESVRRYHEALELFRRLGEPAMEAVAHHQLGTAFVAAHQWEQAEQHYRESARLEEQRGNLAAASRSWNQLAAISQSAGKPEAAETWYRKAIEVGRHTGDIPGLANRLSNFAVLLTSQGGRLAEARQLAEESLAIKQTMDPGAAEIWETYAILAQIADQQSEPDQAAEYRRLARQAKRNFAGTAYEVRRFAPLITIVVSALLGNDDVRTSVNELLQQLKEHNAELALPIERILVGERDVETLCQHAGLDASMIIETILAAIQDPSIILPNLDFDVRIDSSYRAMITGAVVGAVAGNEEAKAFTNQLMEQLKGSSGEGPELAKSIANILAGERRLELMQNLEHHAPIIEDVLNSLKG